MIKGLHHNAYRCRDSEETRVFYEDFLGLRFVSAFEIDQGRALHTFFEMDDGLASPSSRRRGYPSISRSRTC
jgi:catechol 2,3-dioxygenase-like lactoylglutathione lyase family enzyme